MKFDDEICKGVSCSECSFNKREDGCLLAKRLDEIEIIPEPCEDAISRQAAIDIVDSYSESQSNVEDVTQDIISDISALPPATPQPKTGQWIVHEKPYGIRYLECPHCNIWYLNEHLIRNSYCPNCGAKMVESEESEEV